MSVGPVVWSSTSQWPLSDSKSPPSDSTWNAPTVALDKMLDKKPLPGVPRTTKVPIVKIVITPILSGVRLLLAGLLITSFVISSLLFNGFFISATVSLAMRFMIVFLSVSGLSLSRVFEFCVVVIVELSPVAGPFQEPNGSDDYFFQLSRFACVFHCLRVRVFGNLCTQTSFAIEPAHLFWDLLLA